MNQCITLVFLGGSGRNVWRCMASDPWPSGVGRAVCIDSTPNALLPEEKEHLLLIGYERLGGRGAVTPDEGRAVAEQDAERIRTVVEGATAVVIVGGLGGGLGTGAAPVIARMARDMGLRVAAVMCTPFTFEGKRRADIAGRGVCALEGMVDRLAVIAGNRIEQDRPALNIVTAYEAADTGMADAVRDVCRSLLTDRT